MKNLIFVCYVKIRHMGSGYSIQVFDKYLNTVA